MSPVISVVIPTHNRPEMLRRAVDSVHGQIFREWEVIIVDDCSEIPVLASDFSVEPTRLQIVRNISNLGPGASRQVGVNLATGRYLCFLDDDDYYLPNHLERVVKQLGGMPDFRGLLVTGMVTERANGSRHKEDLYDPAEIMLQYWQKPVSLLPFVIPLGAARQWPSPEISSPIEDFEWLCILLSNLPCKILPEYTVVYVEHPENRTVQLNHRADLAAREDVLSRLYARPIIAEVVSSLYYHNQLIHQRLHWTRQCIRQHQWKDAWWGLRRSFNFGSFRRIRDWAYTIYTLLQTVWRMS